MNEYLQVVKQVMSKFCTLAQVSRGQNKHADSQATLTSSTTEDVPWLIKIKLIGEPRINTVVSVAVISSTEPYWMDPIINFLAKDRVPNNEANKVRQVAARY